MTIDYDPVARFGTPVETWNPLDHRAEATRLVDAALTATSEDARRTLYAAAQVHATMASWNYWGGRVRPTRVFAVA